MEIWKPIPSAPNYEASSFGRIRRARSGKRTHVGFILKPRTEMNGYLRVCLRHDSVATYSGVHRLVCEAFHGPCPAEFDCAHYNGIKTDNAPENLRWASRSDNMLDKNRHGTMARGSRSGRSVLTEEDIPTIRDDARSGLSFTTIAKRYGVTPETIRYVVKGATWRHVTA